MVWRLRATGLRGGASNDGKTGQLDAELTGLFEEHNQAGEDATEIPATFLKVLVAKQ